MRLSRPQQHILHELAGGGTLIVSIHCGKVKEGAWLTDHKGVTTPVSYEHARQLYHMGYLNARYIKGTRYHYTLRRKS